MSDVFITNDVSTFDGVVNETTRRFKFPASLRRVQPPYLSQTFELDVGTIEKQRESLIAQIKQGRPDRPDMRAARYLHELNLALGLL